MEFKVTEMSECNKSLLVSGFVIVKNEVHTFELGESHREPFISRVLRIKAVI